MKIKSNGSITPNPFSIQQYNNNVDIKCFEIPRFYYGNTDSETDISELYDTNPVDLSKCSVVMRLSNPDDKINQGSNLFISNDKGENEFSDDDDIVIVNWIITNNVSDYAGKRTYQLEFYDGDVLAFRTQVMNFLVKESLDTEENILIHQPTIFQEFEDKLNDIMNDTNDYTEFIEKEVSDQTSVLEKEINDNVDVKISKINSKVNSLGSGSPLVASSTNGMTDTTRVYVNTTDGNWYYYTGSKWEIGGAYQAVSKDVYYAYIAYNARVNIIENYNGDESCLLYVGNSINVFKNGTLLVEYSKDRLKEKFSSRIVTLDGVDYLKINRHECVYTNLADNTINISTVSQIDNLNNIVNLLTVAPSNVITGELYRVWLKWKKDDIYNAYISYNGRVKIYDDTSIAPNCYFYFDGAIQLYKNHSIIMEYPWDDIKNKFKDRVVVFNGLDYLSLGLRECFYIDLKNMVSHIDTYNNLKNREDILILLNNSNNNAVSGELYNAWLKQINKYSIYAYIGYNKKVDIVEKSSIAPNIYLYCEDEIHLKRNGDLYAIRSFPWSSVLSKFSDRVVNYDNKNYISLNQNECFYINLINLELEIAPMSNIQNNNNVCILLLNANNNAIKGQLYDIWLKWKQTNKELFNSIAYLDNLDIRSKCVEFSNALAISEGTNLESFIFFTDPHLMGGGSLETSNKLESYIGTLQKVYNSTPSNFIVCGGDWLNSNDTDEQVVYKLGYIDGFMRSLFKNFYNVVGNHDIKDDGATSKLLDKNIMSNLWFRDKKKCYYKFNGLSSINYVIDNSSYSSDSMTSYAWEQINWLGTQLLNDNPSHATIFTHITIKNDTKTATKFLDNITKLIKAFNNHTSITLNGVTYNFSSSSGHVDYILGGHTHYDWEGVVNDVICITTRSFYKDVSSPTFDFIVNDYENHKVKLLRFGTGTNREYDI